MNGDLSSVSGAFSSASVASMSASREKKVVFDTQEATGLWGGRGGFYCSTNSTLQCLLIYTGNFYMDF